MGNEMDGIELVARMAICRACFVMKGPFHDGFNRCERVQRCACEPKEPLWNAFDYNQAAVLCGCCAAQVVRSGSKWSAFFCRECQERVIAYDRAVGEVVIPIGRHSLMNGSLLRVEDAPKRRKRETFVEGMVGLFCGMTRLGEHKQANVTSIVRAIPEPAGAVPVPVYLEHANRMNADRAAAFARLVEAMEAS